MAQLISFVKDISQLFGARVVGIALVFGMSILVARELGPEGRGVYAWVMTLAMIGANFALLGMDTCNRRVVGADKTTAPMMVGTSLAMGLLGGAVFIPLLFITGSLFPIGAAHMLVMLLALLAMPAAALVMSLDSVLMGLGRIDQAVRVAIYPKLLPLVLLGGLIALGGVTVLSVTLVMVVTSFAAVGLLLFYMRDLLPSMRVSLAKARSMMGYVVGAWLAALLLFLMQKVDVLMVGALLGEAQTGWYSVASSLADAVMMLAGATGIVLLARLAGIKDVRQRNRFKYQVAALLFGVMLVGCGLAAVLAPWVVPLLFGAPFAPAVMPFQLLMLAVWLSAPYFVAQNALAATGRARYMLPGPVAGLVVNVALNMVLIPRWGINGAAAASVVAYAIASVVTLVVDYYTNTKSPVADGNLVDRQR